MARRLEAHCVHRRALETGRPEATFRRFRRAFRVRSRRMAWSSPARRQCATTTPFSVEPVPRGCSFRFRAEKVNLFQRSCLEISRFNGATTADTCIRVERAAAGAPSAVDVFRVELTTGVRVLWKTLSPSDPVGVQVLTRYRSYHTGRSVVFPTCDGLATCSWSTD